MYLQHLTHHALCPPLHPLQARIITEGSYPYRVVFVNNAWEEMCGWTAEEVQGLHGLSFLQGPETEKAKLKRVGEAVKYGEVRMRWWCGDGGNGRRVVIAACRLLLVHWFAGWHLLPATRLQGCCACLGLALTLILKHTQAHSNWLTIAQPAMFVTAFCVHFMRRVDNDADADTARVSHK